MSDTWVYLAASDPAFVPDAEARRRVETILAPFERIADCIEVCSRAEPQVLDAGANTEKVHCPACVSELPLDWFMDQVDAWHGRTDPFDLLVQTPCCGRRLSLNDLELDWPWAFACFWIEIMNPKCSELDRGLIESLERCIGCTLREVRRHL